MAITISAEKELKNIKRNIQFCYLCGRILASGPQRNRDHIPPLGLFALADRHNPLILPTHSVCNASRSQEDQTIGQLVGVLHGRRVNPNHNKLQIKVGQFDDGSRGAALEGFDLKESIRRWIRGFHAALYGEYLSPSGSFATYTPLPEAIRDGEKLVFSPVPPVFPKFVEELKRNRVVGNLDSLTLWNGKCRYQCVWSQADNREWICIYCLDLYNWTNLADTRHFPARGCVGCYRRDQGGVPRPAATATKLIFELENASRLLPF